MVTLVLLLAGLAPGVEADLDLIARVNPPLEQEAAAPPAADFTFRQVSELRLCLSVMIRLYQVFVSPQGPPGCNFTVTCSHFMTRSVQKYGLIHGLLMESDRLTRCNHAARRYYPRDRFTGRSVDHPVDAYYLFRRDRILRRQAGE